MDSYQKARERAAKRQLNVHEQFTRNVAEHEIEVLHDEGSYRHLRFRREKSRNYMFDLVTWPWHLAITGDMGGQLFCRLEDMFQFFRSSTGDINPQYWAEKIVSEREAVRKYDEGLFQDFVMSEAAENEVDFPGLAKAVEKSLVSEWSGVEWGSEDIARFEVNCFEFPDKWKREKGDPFFRFDLTDTDFRDWTYHYLWQCYAIQWGIAQYDAHKGRATDGT